MVNAGNKHVPTGDAKHDLGVTKGYNKTLNTIAQNRLTVEDVIIARDNLWAQPVPRNPYIAGIQEGTYQALTHFIEKSELV